MAAMKFRCRKCRQFLFCGDDLATNHVQKKECSSWYLRDDDEMPAWTHDLINESGWTEGKLYCPKCKGRIGGFDFLHVVHCSCLSDVIPAIWCPKSRVDQIINIDLKDKGCKEIQTMNEANGSSSKPMDMETTGSRQCDDDTTVSEGARNTSKETQALKEGCIPMSTRFFRKRRGSTGIYDGIFLTPEDTNLTTASSSSNFNSDGLNHIIEERRRIEKRLNSARIDESILDSKEKRDPADHYEANGSSSKSMDMETTGSRQCDDDTTVSEGARNTSKETQVLKEGCIPMSTRFFRKRRGSTGNYDGIFLTPEDTNLSTASSSSNFNSDGLNHIIEARRRIEKRLNSARIDESILDSKEKRDTADHYCLCRHRQCCVTKTQSCHHCCHCGKDNDGGNTACIATNLCCESVSHIHESIRVIRKEIVDLYSTRNDELKNGAKNQRKPRRRGRGNWQHECDYLKAMDDMKRISAENDVDPPKNLLVSRPRKQAHSFIMEEKELSDSEIPDSFKCAVCLSLLHQPHQTPCQHVFCGICMKQLHHVSRGRPKCPLCREPIRYVVPEEEMEAEIQVSFPVNYRKRAKETRKNRHRKGVLPSPQTTRFDSTEESETRNTSRVVHHLSVIALIISIVINSILINARGNAAVRLDLQRKLAIFVLIVLGIMVASLMLLLLIVFALDFVKVALFLVLSYVAMSKLVLTAVLD